MAILSGMLNVQVLCLGMGQCAQEGETSGFSSAPSCGNPANCIPYFFTGSPESKATLGWVEGLEGISWEGESAQTQNSFPLCA